MLISLMKLDNLQDKYSVKFLIADFKKNNGFKNSIDLSKNITYTGKIIVVAFFKKERVKK